MEVAHWSTGGSSRQRLMVLGAIGLVLMVWQHRAWQEQAISLPEYIAYRLTAPLEGLFARAFRAIHDGFIGATSAPRLVARVRELEAELNELHLERVKDADVRAENRALRETLGLVAKDPGHKVAAEVISRSSGRESRWVKIRAPRGAGLRTGDVVRDARGLVGRITSVQGDVAQVVLLVDPEHAVRGRDLRTGEEGMIYPALERAAGPSRVGLERPAGPNRLRFEKTRHGAQVAVGDTIVTSGIGETYPGGIPIGVVEKVAKSPYSESSLVAYVKPFVDFDRLEFVYVLRASGG